MRIRDGFFFGGGGFKKELDIVGDCRNHVGGKPLTSVSRCSMHSDILTPSRLTKREPYDSPGLGWGGQGGWRQGVLNFCVSGTPTQGCSV